jgi:uncharacterized tellurite resistance protein B-like protein
MRRLTDFLLVQFFGELLRRLDALEAQGVKIMAGIEDARAALTAQIDRVIAASAAEREQVLAKIQELIDAGLGATPEQLDQLVAEINAAGDRAVAEIGSIFEEPTPVTPPV